MYTQPSTLSIISPPSDKKAILTRLFKQDHITLDELLVLADSYNYTPPSIPCNPWQSPWWSTTTPASPYIATTTNSCQALLNEGPMHPAE